MQVTDRDTKCFRNEWRRVDEIYDAAGFAMPVRYIFMLTNGCNLRCPFCTMEHIASVDEMQEQDWLRLADEVPDYGRVVLMGGEPLYYEGFDRVFQRVASSHDCSLVTNGTLLDDARIANLLAAPRFLDLGISIDVIGNDTRGFTDTQWVTLVSGVKKFRSRREESSHKPGLGIKTVILDSTASRLFELHRYTREELGCDANTYGTLAGSSMQLSDRMRSFDELFCLPSPYMYKEWETILEQIDMIRAYDKKHGYRSYFRPKVLDMNSDAPTVNLNILQCPRFDKELFARCKVPWSDCRIYGDGSVTACLSVCLGNVKADSLSNILSGAKAMCFKKTVRDHCLLPQCHRCNYSYSVEFE